MATLLGTLKTGLSPVPTADAAELDEWVARLAQLSDGELMHIAMGDQQTDVTTAPQSRKLLIPNPR